MKHCSQNYIYQYENKIFELNGTHFIHITRFLPNQLNNVGHDGKALSSLGYTGFVDTLTCSWNLYFLFFIHKTSQCNICTADIFACEWTGICWQTLASSAQGWWHGQRSLLWFHLKAAVFFGYVCTPTFCLAR